MARLLCRHEGGCLVVTGPVAAHGVKPVFGIGPVEYFLALDPCFEWMGVDAERVAREYEEVGILARLEGADTIGEVE